MIAEQAPVCKYPQGGTATTAGGEGIFLDSAGEPIRIWVDYMLRNGRTIIKTAQNEMAEAVSFHQDPETQLLILHPSSFRLFDSYCHPDWLSAKRRNSYDKYMEQHEDEEEDWTRKVLLKEGWMARCIGAGRFLGESDDWAGCRVGGPPKGQPVDIEADPNTITLNAGVKREANEDVAMDTEIVMDAPMAEDVVMEEPIVEDIKPEPEPIAPPTPVSMPAVIHVEPPTPLEPLINDEMPVDESHPMEEDVDELKSLFGDMDRSPSPPVPLRRSRRSRSTTNKELEAPENVSEASFSRRSPSRSRSRESSFPRKSQPRSRSRDFSANLADDFMPIQSVASGSKRPLRHTTRTLSEEREVSDGFSVPKRKAASASKRPSRKAARTSYEFRSSEDEDFWKIKPRSRRARYQAVSSDEPPLASKVPTRRASQVGSDTAKATSVDKGKLKSAATSLLGDDFDITMLDSGPSSRFQSPPAPPAPTFQPVPVAGDVRLFSGLVFWVDLGMKNRGDLLKELKTAGGKIVADYADATHVLIYKPAQQATQWKEPIAEHARKGIWFLSSEWAKKSLAEKTILPEEDHCLAGSIIAGLVSPKSMQAALPDVQQSAGSTEKATLPPGRLSEILKEESRIMRKEGGLSPGEIAMRLEAKYGLYSIPEWREHYKTWKNRTAQPDQTPALSRPSASASAFAPLEETALKVKSEPLGGSPIKARLDKAGLEAIFAKETWRLERVCLGKMGDFTKFLAGKYGLYTPGSWGNYYNDWNGGRGRWSAAGRTFQGAVLTLEELREGPVANIATPRRDTAPLPGPSTRVPLPGPSTRVPLSTMASAFTTYFKHSGDNIVINASLGEHMEALYPAYTARSWENMAREWFHGSGRFSVHGLRWPGESDTVEALDPVDPQSQRAKEAAVSASEVNRYTQDEELAMGQFVLHQEDNGKPVTRGSWATFAEVDAHGQYQHRTKGAWAEHWRKYKDRIMKIVNDHQADEDVDELEEEPVESAVKDESPPVASGSKPKKQKLAVSKKDYEDLAHFIVDNIAEGNVPTTKDFEDFSEDHPHRNGAAWYTIWHRDRYRSTLLPLIEEYRRAATPARSQSRTKSARPLPNAYTDEEERAMAEFIVRHVPSDRPPKAADWAKFQKTHTRRSAPSWTEHYRVYRPRITALVDEIRVSQPSIARRPAGTAQNAIELESEEEEEEEVEDIVPIRPTRPRKSRDIIVIDED